MANEHLDERKSALLSQIIEEFVVCAEPIGSRMIVDKYDWDVSPATVRAEMSELEEEGYTTHPHTSAGRMPTEKGYQWYVSTLDTASVRIPGRLGQRLEESITGSEGQEKIKKLAREVAEIATNAVVVGFGRNDSYYTGLSYLFSQPEFKDINLVRSFSEILDQLDDALSKFVENAGEETVIAIGKRNPFGTECSFVSGKLEYEGCVFGILGPLRMDYKKNIGLINWMRENV